MMDTFNRSPGFVARRRRTLTLTGTATGDHMARIVIEENSMADEPTHELHVLFCEWDCVAVGSEAQCRAGETRTRKRMSSGVCAYEDVRVVPRVLASR